MTNSLDAKFRLPSSAPDETETTSFSFNPGTHETRGRPLWRQVFCRFGTGWNEIQGIGQSTSGARLWLKGESQQLRHRRRVAMKPNPLGPRTCCGWGFDQYLFSLLAAPVAQTCSLYRRFLTSCVRHAKRLRGFALSPRGTSGERVGERGN